ncbi:MAG TPA: lipoyl(octanoyl) transferase LipB [Nitrospira sp.]|nr:lipoyl(octanoyl) transferase LipB [Nitrospira sp.]
MRGRQAELLLFQEPVSYATAWALQSRVHHERVGEARPDTVLILEHLPVYTLGRSTKPSDWGGDPARLQAEGAEVHHVNRGGSVTYHGPGQVIIYPVLRLTQYARGVKQYVQQLEDVIIACLRDHGIEGQRREKTPGVWVAAPHDAKIASIGIRVDRGVTMHGIALNVQMDLSPFGRITPCGLSNCRVTSMAEVLGRPVSVADAKRDLALRLGALLGIDWLPPSLNRET